MLQANAESLTRLRAVVDRLDDATLQLTVREGWTISALLAHLAFWDHSCLIRWDAFAQQGAFVGFGDDMEAFINEASLPLWRTVPGHVAAAMAVEAAVTTDLATIALSDEALAYAKAMQRDFMLDRSAHRNAHLDEIEAALLRHEAGVSL
jgi:hypothetical protein